MLDVVVFAAGAAVGGMLASSGFLVLSRQHWTSSGTALIVTGPKSTTVHLKPVRLLSLVQHGEEIDISTRILTIERSGAQGLICRDNIRVDMVARFYVRINATTEDVLKVAQSIGCERAGQQEAIEALFEAKFSESLKMVSRQMSFEELISQRESFRDHVFQVIGRDLGGFVLEDLAIDSMAQTPVEQLDPDNILDAQGIKKITEITNHAHMETLALKQERAEATARHEAALKEL